MRAKCFLLLICLTTSLQAQEDLRVLPADPPPARMLRQYLLSAAGKQFDARREAIAGLKTPADIARRQESLRADFLEALGGLPPRTPLNPVVVGRVPRDGYTIEKVIYESRPNHHVTASLYLPESRGKVPGVLMPIGHSDNGKAADYIQRGAALLAQHGIAVLTYDPIGQGERRQLLNAEGRTAIAKGTDEHTLIGVGAILVGRGTASYRIWDGMRSLDYLASRPEIDPARLGCTGCSGGGTLTSYLMSLDERIVAAAPSCYLTSLERLFATIGPQDAEQNITGQVAFGLEHADYVLLHSPRPTLICAATRDFFDIQGTWTTFREAKRMYGLLGHSERIDLVESDSGHGFPKPQREATLRFMRRWLLDIDDAPTEGDVSLVKDPDLQCTTTGQVLSQFRGQSVFELNAQRADELAAARANRGSSDLAGDVRRLLALPAAIPPAKVLVYARNARSGLHFHSFVTEPGITVPALKFVPNGEPQGPWVVYLHAQGKSAAAAPGGPIEKLLSQRRRVLAIDVRGMGETAPSSRPGGIFGNEYTESFLALHLNRPLLGQRVYDLLSVLAALPEETRKEGVELIGTGPAGLIALHAAVLDDRIKAVTLEQTLGAWSDVVKTPQAQRQLSHVIPGVLAAYDLPDLCASLAPRPLTIRQPADARGEPLSAEAASGTYAPVRAAYERHQQGKALELELTTK